MLGKVACVGQHISLSSIPNGSLCIVSSLCAPLQCDELATFPTAAAAANLMTRLLCSDVSLYLLSVKPVE
jgi:hypothetical protein